MISAMLILMGGFECTGRCGLELAGGFILIGIIPFIVIAAIAVLLYKIYTKSNNLKLQLVITLIAYIWLGKMFIDYLTGSYGFAKYYMIIIGVIFIYITILLTAAISKHAK